MTMETRCCQKKGSLSKIPALTFLYRSLCCQLESGEIPSLQQTLIDENNYCVMKSERLTLVRVSDSPSGHGVHNTAGDIWRAPAGRQIQKHLAAGV